jgi:hypothetical protein
MIEASPLALLIFLVVAVQNSSPLFEFPTAGAQVVGKLNRRTLLEVLTTRLYVLCLYSWRVVCLVRLCKGVSVSAHHYLYLIYSR